MNALHVTDRSNATPAGDAGLLARLRAGEPAAYEELVREHSGRMLAVARRMLRCESEAADAVQDAFLSAFQGLESFREGSQLATWLHRIVVNASLMRLRTRSRRPAVSIEELLPRFDATGHHAQAVAFHDDQAADQLIQAETRRQVRECIDQLPDDYRIILLLRDIEGLDTGETAERLGVSTPAVKTRLHRARQALRTLLEDALVG